MIKIKPIKAYTDNYIWLVTTNEGTLVIDPGEYKPVSDYLKKEDVYLDSILITHHHFDHIGGLADLLKENKDIKVVGPKNHINEIKTRVNDGDVIETIGLKFLVKIYTFDQKFLQIFFRSLLQREYHRKIKMDYHYFHNKKQYDPGYAQVQKLLKTLNQLSQLHHHH